ncbi:hypothetical protein Y032_0691g1569 [Ancylostoma ceylanicum]|uniref:Uncharacterized protein n=1 Tax=Ancylostoma ceylanicum TaxID=53326 RepID=A0A016WII4_9BILA|nr:hypothetical protein Y032_0691g1569 [Ancylostoma ceylanicum]
MVNTDINVFTLGDLKDAFSSWHAPINVITHSVLIPRFYLLLIIPIDHWRRRGGESCRSLFLIVYFFTIFKYLTIFE